MLKILFYEKFENISFDFDKNEHKNPLILIVNHKDIKMKLNLYYWKKRKFYNKELNLVEDGQNNKIIGNKINWEYSIALDRDKNGGISKNKLKYKSEESKVNAKENLW